MPALFQAFRHGTLPEGGRILCVARDDLSDDQYRRAELFCEFRHRREYRPNLRVPMRVDLSA